MTKAEIDATEMIFHLQETRKHVQRVQTFMFAFAKAIIDRAMEHDGTKFENDEASAFAKTTPKLRGLTYGSEEYKSVLRELGPALAHHYQWNSHHPEHYEDSISGMDMLDIVEMLCDWRAATERHNDGSITRSIAHNATRWSIDGQLVRIFHNTVPWMENVSKDKTNGRR